MTTALLCYTGPLVGTEQCLGTLHHIAVQWRMHRKLRQTKVRPKLTGSMVGVLDAHSHSDIHSNRCTYTHKQMDRHTPSFQQAPHLGDSYFRKEHSIRTHIASSSPPFLLSPCFLCSLLPYGLLRHHSSLFSASTLYIALALPCF